MTTITITRASDDTYKRIECKGHAGFSEYGTDIVCAAISVFTINLINSIDELTDDDVVIGQDEEKGILSLKFNSKPSHDSVVLIRAFELGVDSIFQQYGKKYLNIKFRRE